METVLYVKIDCHYSIAMRSEWKHQFNWRMVNNTFQKISLSISNVCTGTFMNWFTTPTYHLHIKYFVCFVYALRIDWYTDFFLLQSIWGKCRVFGEGGISLHRTVTTMERLRHFNNIKIHICKYDNECVQI